MDTRTIALSRSIDMVDRFNSNIDALLGLLGESDVVILPAGSAIEIYKTSGTLNNTQVAEAQLINLSDYKSELVDTKSLAFNKYRALIGVESIARMGYEKAIVRPFNKLVSDVQANIRASIFTALGTGTGTATAGNTLQAALANAWAAVEEGFDGVNYTPVFFINTTDAAEYLGTANILLAERFGLRYMENFLGLGNVIVDKNVPQGTVYATAAQNLIVYAPDASGISEGELDFYSDETGLLAITRDPKAENAAEQIVVISGVAVFPLYIDKIFVGAIEPEEAAEEADDNEGEH